MIKEVFKKIFLKPKYITISILIALFFYKFNAILPNIKLLLNANSFKDFFIICKNLVFGFHNTIKLHSLISTILIAILFGILFSLILYKTKTIKEDTGKIGILSTIAIFIGILAPGCAACGIGILSAIGLGAIIIQFLPLNGLEFSIISIILLSVAIYKISEKIHKGNICKIKISKK